MIDPKLLRNNIEAVNLALAKRGVQLNVEEWASLEVRRKEIQSKTESLQAERNSGAKQVGQIKKAGGDASEIMTRMSAIGDEIKAAEVALSELQAELEAKSLAFQTCQMSLFLKEKTKVITWKSSHGVRRVRLTSKLKTILTLVSGWVVLSLKQRPN